MNIEEIKAREQAATSGSWEAGGCPKRIRQDLQSVYREVGCNGGQWDVCRDATPADAAFIAHARTDIPALIAEVERLTHENSALQNANDKLVKQSKRIISRNLDHSAEDATLKKALELAEDMLTKMTPYKSKGGWHDRLIHQAQQLTHETHGDTVKVDYVHHDTTTGGRTCLK
jgi:hypothetical protein